MGKKLLSDTALKALILQSYNRYKIFVNDDTLPTPIIKINHLNGKTNAVKVDYPTYPKGNYTLEVYRGMEKFDIKQTLYHEFTHIYDAQMFFKNMYGNEKKTLIEPYSEIHASVVELMVTFGFDAISSHKEVRLYDTLMYHTKEFSLDSFVEYYHSQIHKLQDEAHAAPLYANIEKVIKHTLYYFGILVFCKRYCLDNFLKHVDFSTFENFFGRNGEMLFALVYGDTTTTEDVLVQIKNLRWLAFNYACCKLGVSK